MPIVSMPDGTRVSFPDDMPGEQIRGLIASKFPDAEREAQYKRAAQEDLAFANEQGFGPSSLARRAVQGATFNAADEILAGLQTPVEMYRRGTLNPAEGYRYAKAYQDAALEQARKETGALGTAAEIGGGVVSGSGLARGGLSTAARLAPNAGLGTRSIASAADAAAYGTVAGAMEGNSLSERAGNAAIGGAVGGVVGGAAPAVISAAGTVAAPIVSNIRARANPQGYAQSQVARGLSETTATPQAIADDVAMAAQEGQGVYTLADAMGNPGQRMLSAVTRAPGPGRTAAVDFLEQRQAGQGRLVVNALTEGFEAPQTAGQTKDYLTNTRRSVADASYGAARQQAGSVNVSPAIAEIDRTLQPGASRVFNPASGMADDSIEASLRKARSFLTDGRSQVSRFDEALRVKQELDNLIEAANPARQRVLIPVRNALDEQLAQASAPYAAARNQYRSYSQAIDAVDEGATAAQRGRTEDIVPRFRSMPPGRQAAFRAGYADPLIAQAEGAAFGANKARPLTSDAFTAESAAIAPMRTGPTMARRIGRENRMFETRAAALGGSKTADNLADADALGVDPSIVANALSGNWSGAARNALTAGSNALTGNTPAVREELARLLLMRGQNVTPQQLQDIAQLAQNRVQMGQILAQLGRGASGGLAIGTAATNR